MREGEMWGVLSRYILLIVLALGDFWLIYAVFTIPTITASYFFIKAIYPSALLLGDATIFFKGYYAQIIPACIAGAAYYLLAILNLTTPMPISKRIGSLVFLLSSFFLINVARIVLFAWLFEQGFNYFDITHLISWYVGSTFLVILLWFSTTVLFRIKSIPVYTDLLHVVKEVKKHK